MKNVTEMKLDLVKGVEISVVKLDGTKQTKFLSSKVLKDRINNVLYQVLSHAIGRDAQQMLDESAFENVPDEPLFNDVKSGLIKIDKEHVYVFKNHFYVGDKKYAFKDEKETYAKLDFAKEYHKYLKEKKQNGKSNRK